jgi:hypothetical protein
MVLLTSGNSRVYFLLTICAVFFLRYVLSHDLKFCRHVQALEFISPGCQVSVDCFLTTVNFIPLQQLAFLRNFQGRFKCDVACS